jgi:hypothetical protein
MELGCPIDRHLVRLSSWKLFEFVSLAGVSQKRAVES